MEPETNAAAQKPSVVRRAVRWVPLAALVLLAAWLAVGLFGGGRAGVASWYGLQILIPGLGAVVLVGALAYAAWRRRWRSPAVRATVAGGVLALALLPWTFGLVPLRYPASLERTGPAATVRLPLDGPVLVAWGGDTVGANYHATTPDQRWAYDLAVEPAFTESDRLEDYGCYGVPVVAPAAGLVTVARDGDPDIAPGALPGLAETPAGNHVGLRLEETGTHLVVAHLQRGSVAVRAGQRVAEGDALGRCGNSGNTSEPHVHIHHQREDPAEVPTGFAEGLPLYFRDHDGPPMPEGGFRERGGEVVPVGPTVRHVGRR